MSLDIVTEIRLDHDNVRDLFERFKASEGDIQQQRKIANTLVREMAIHSDAEEVSLYNVYEQHGHEDWSQHDKEEHAEVKKALYQAEADSLTEETAAQYAQTLGKAVEMFISHAEEEENDQLPKLSKMLTRNQSDEAARDFLKARSMVPTRPHPVAPQTGDITQKALGAGAKAIDKLMESMSGKDFVDLKFQHAEI